MMNDFSQRGMKEDRSSQIAEASNYPTWASVTKGYGKGFDRWFRKEYRTLKAAKEDFIADGFPDESMAEFFYNTYQNALRDGEE